MWNLRSDNEEKPEAAPHTTTCKHRTWQVLVLKVLFGKTKSGQQNELQWMKHG